VQGPQTGAVPVLALLLIDCPDPGRGPCQRHRAAAELHDDAGALRRKIESGAEALMALPPEMFAAA
jgi:hypothetical protein